MSEAVKVMGMGVPAFGGWEYCIHSSSLCSGGGEGCGPERGTLDDVHWTHVSSPASVPGSNGRETEPRLGARGLGGCLSQYTCHHRCGFGAFRSRAEGSSVCSLLRCEPLSLCRGVCVSLEGRSGGLWPCGLDCPPVSVQALGLSAEAHVALCGLWERVLNPSLWH